jgi:hypothetical protein
MKLKCLDPSNSTTVMCAVITLLLHIVYSYSIAYYIMSFLMCYLCATHNVQRAFTSPLGAGRVTSAGVQQVYSVLQAATGSLGGNGNSGAIYGELTQNSMQRVVDLLKVQ